MRKNPVGFVNFPIEKDIKWQGFLSRIDWFLSNVCDEKRKKNMNKNLQLLFTALQLANKLFP